MTASYSDDEGQKEGQWARIYSGAFEKSVKSASPALKTAVFKRGRFFLMEGALLASLLAVIGVSSMVRFLFSHERWRMHLGWVSFAAAFIYMAVQWVLRKKPYLKITQVRLIVNERTARERSITWDSIQAVKNTRSLLELQLSGNKTFRIPLFYIERQERSEFVRTVEAHLKGKDPGLKEMAKETSRGEFPPPSALEQIEDRRFFCEYYLLLLSLAASYLLLEFLSLFSAELLMGIILLCGAVFLIYLSLKGLCKYKGYRGIRFMSGFLLLFWSFVSVQVTRLLIRMLFK